MSQLPPEVWKALRAFVEPYAVGSFVVAGEPAQKQRARHARDKETGKVRTYTEKKTVDGEKRVARIFAEALPGWQPEPDETWGALVEIHTGGGATTDLDNIAKLVLDALNKRAWHDDIQVGDLYLHLDRGRSEPRVEVLVFQTVHNGTRRTTVCACGTRFRAAGARCNPCKDAGKKAKAAVAPATIDDLLGPPPKTADYGVLRRKVFNAIAVALAAGKQPNIAAIVRQLAVPREQVELTITQLIAGGWITRSGRNYTVIRSLGEAA